MKTKKQLLAVMERLYACGTAINYVSNHDSDSALEIGLRCNKPEWLIWFLEKRLTTRGRRLFARRLGVGCSDRYATDDLWRAGMVVHSGLDRAVIDDCWRAWCRSKP